MRLKRANGGGKRNGGNILADWEVEIERTANGQSPFTRQRESQVFLGGRGLTESSRVEGDSCKRGEECHFLGEGGGRRETEFGCGCDVSCGRGTTHRGKTRCPKQERVDGLIEVHAATQNAAKLSSFSASCRRGKMEKEEDNIGRGAQGWGSVEGAGPLVALSACATRGNAPAHVSARSPFTSREPSNT